MTLWLACAPLCGQVTSAVARLISKPLAGRKVIQTAGASLKGFWCTCLRRPRQSAHPALSGILRPLKGPPSHASPMEKELELEFI